LLGRIVAFPVRQEFCSACCRPTSTHRVNGRWVGCSRDIVIGRDVATFDKWLRVAALQPRVVKVQPFGIGAGDGPRR
jgi:hypothetical protein